MNKIQWDQVILHVDMDAFFVNVHILDHPEDAGIPLVVGGKPNQRGVVTSASYEARQFGVRSAMPTSKALRLCRNLKIVPAKWERIRECSKKVMDALDPFGPLEKMSVDEAYLDLSHYNNPQQIAQTIKTAVQSKTGLPCSIGLASSKLVAKVASDYDKPQGFTVVQPGKEAEFLAPMPTRAIWGIGPRTAQRLADYGIETCGQLAAADEKILKRQIGRQAKDLIRRAQGKDERKVQTDRGPAKSISQEWTFNQDINDPNLLQDHLRKMSARVAKSLQENNLIAQTVTVKIRWFDFKTITRQRSISVGIDNSDEIYQIAVALFNENWDKKMRIRLLGVGVSSIQEGNIRQLSFNFE